jgi:HSP20 family molecular chaperone IbpA
MNAFQALNDVNQDLAGSFAGLPTGCQQSTLWIAHTEETPIADIKIQEKDMTLILKVHISDIHLVKLNLQITPETVLIQGQPTEAAEVEGYFLPSGFQSLIPLPHRVHPEIYETEIHSDRLTIQLAKELRVPPSQVRIPLSTANLSYCSKMCI